MSKTPCRPRRHMTVSWRNGEKILVFNWSCIPHGIIRRSYTGPKLRNQDLKEHLERHGTEPNKIAELF